jgi:hypothetical protein
MFDIMCAASTVFRAASASPIRASLSGSGIVVSYAALRPHIEVIPAGVKQFTSARRKSSYQKVRTLAGGTYAVTRQPQPNQPRQLLAGNC